MENNYAFVDSQNLNLGIQNLGWKLDYRRFRVYLAEKYGLWIICGINWSIKRKAPLKDETLRSAFPYKYNFMIANPKIMSRGNYKYIRGDFIKNIYKIIIKKSNLYD